MDIEKETIEALTELVSSRLPTLLLKFIAIVIAIYLLKHVAEGVASYILFRVDEHVSIGTPVKVFDRDGRIKSANIFTIVVELSIGYIRIPMKNWRNSRYIVLKDSVLIKNRRTDDAVDECVS